MSTMNTPDATYDAAATSMADKPRVPFGRNLVAAAFAGMFIGFGYVFATTVQIGGLETSSFGVTKLLGGLVFSGGIFATIVTGADLFTSATLTTIPRVQGRLGPLAQVRHWTVVYLGNMLGATLLAGLIVLSGTGAFAGGEFGASIITTAIGKDSHSWGEAFVLGILCNVLVCLAVWMSYAGKSLVDKFFAVVLPISLFVATGFEHSVANMFVIPTALLLIAQGDQAVAAVLANTPIEALSWSSYLLNNLIPVTLGNIVAGIGFSLAMYAWRRPLRERGAAGGDS